MLQKIKKGGQLSIPKKMLARLQLKEGDCVEVKYSDSQIVISRAANEDLPAEDLDRLAARLADAEMENGLVFSDSDSARQHLRKLMQKP